METAASYKASHKQDKAQEAWMCLVSVGRVTKGRSIEALVSSCTPLRPSLPTLDPTHSDMGREQPVLLDSMVCLIG